MNHYVLHLSFYIFPLLPHSFGALFYLTFLVSLAQLPKSFIIFSQNTVEGESRGVFNFLVLVHAVL